MALLTEREIISRYRENYGLSNLVSGDQVRRHKQLEAELTEKLMSSTPETRWQVFSECYTSLYRDLSWLNEASAGKPRTKDGAWPKLLKNRSVIFEVGSGKGDLLRSLAKLGHDCVGTEITIERGEKHVDEVDGLKWRVTDGVNLAKFEPMEAYDVIISSQVIEHFHPSDVQNHFENVRMLLKPEGEYIFDTPHIGTGPHDLSKVFGLDRPAFMHLKEYDFRELGGFARVAGFKDICAIIYWKAGGLSVGPIKSKLLFKYFCFVDRVIAALSLNPTRERAVRRFLRVALVPSNIWLAVKK